MAPPSRWERLTPVVSEKELVVDVEQPLGLNPLEASRCTFNGVKVIRRCVPLSQAGDAAQHASLVDECEYLVSVKSDYLVKFCAVTLTGPDDPQSLVMENLVPYFTAYPRNTPIPPIRQRVIILQALGALDALETAAVPIVHGCFSPWSFWADELGNIKLGDLGRLSRGSCPPDGELAAYRAPEMREDGAVPTTAADRYSFGLFIMAMGSSNTSPLSPDERASQIGKLTPFLSDIVRASLAPAPAARSTVRGLYQLALADSAAWRQAHDSGAAENRLYAVGQLAAIVIRHLAGRNDVAAVEMCGTACRAVFVNGAHPRNIVLMHKTPAPEAVVEVYRRYPESVTAVTRASEAVCNLSAAGLETATRMCELGAMELLVPAFNRFMDNVDFVKQGCYAMYNSAFGEANALRAHQSGIVECLKRVVVTHPTRVEILHLALGALSNAGFGRDGANAQLGREAGVVEVIVEVMKKHPENGQILRAGARGLASFAVKGEPAARFVIDRGGAEMSLHALKYRGDGADGVMESATHMVSMLGFGATNITSMIANIEPVLKAMNDFPGNATVQENGCTVIKNMSAGAENAERMREMGGVVAAVEALKRFPDAVNVQKAGLLAITNLAALAVNNADFCAGQGAVEVVVLALEKHKGALGVVEAGCWAARCLCGGPESKQRIVGSGVVERFVEVMSLHPMSTSVQTHCCGGMASLNTLSQQTIAEVLAKGGGTAVVAAMRNHIGTLAVQEQGLWMLRNAAYGADNTTGVHQAGGVERVVACMRAFPNAKIVHEQGCAALKNLGALGRVNALNVYATGGVQVISEVVNNLDITLTATFEHAFWALKNITRDVTWIEKEHAAQFLTCVDAMARPYNNEAVKREETEFVINLCATQAVAAGFRARINFLLDTFFTTERAIRAIILCTFDDGSK